MLGAAMLGAVAGGAYASIGETMASMSALGRLSEPTAPRMAEFHRTKRAVHKLLRTLDQDSREAMRAINGHSQRRIETMILSCGDALIDFVPVVAADGRDAARPAVGGSCLNIAVGIARLGVASGFVGGISTDLFGRMIADHATASNVDLRYATRSAHQTTLAFVRIVAGELQYAFYDAETASANWSYQRGSIPST